jgi:putative flippase GtrA
MPTVELGYTGKIMKLADFRPTRRNLIQLLEYVIGGSVYFWSGYIVFAVGYSGLHWDWLWAKIAADVIGLTLNYLVQRYWAFNSKGLKKHEADTAGKYSVISVVNIGLDYLIIWGLKTLGVSPYLGFFISAGFFGAWNYVWYRFWVFYSKGNATEGVTHE